MRKMCYDKNQHDSNGAAEPSAQVPARGVETVKKQLLYLGLPLAALVVLLSGCFRSVDDLYTVPEAPPEYYALQTRLREVRDQGGEYIAPLTGEYIQSVQLHDLDGDGVMEAIAFFRVSSDARPLKIYIYRQVDAAYEVSAVIEGAGTAINAVSYENLDDSPSQELVVSWQMSDQLHSLAAYSVDRGEVVELLRTNYSSYLLYDLDMDGRTEVAVVQTGTGEGENRVELYNCLDSVVELESSAPLSRGITGILEGGLSAGYLRGGIPAVFVPSTYEEKGFITDIFAWRNRRLTNITLDEETQESGGTVRWYNGVDNGASASDINGDRITEVPLPVPMKDANRTGGASNFWSVRWWQYDLDGIAWPVFTTYHNERDKWYFILPEEWDGVITLERRDAASGGERAVVFSYWPHSGAEPEPFLTIYTLTGSNRDSLAALPGRFQLAGPAGDGGALYAAQLHPCSWDCGLDEAGVREHFKLIKTAW